MRSRSPSPTLAQWPTEDSGYDYDSDAERRKAIELSLGTDAQQESVGVGVPGRTGVKGVIRDSREAAATARAKRHDEIRAINRAMEKASLGGKTWAEEERERLTRKAFEEGRPEPMDQTARRGRFGHLREVGVRGYVQAVESEERNIWVVVHIYDPVSGVIFTKSYGYFLTSLRPVARPMCHIGRNIISSCTPIPFC